MSGHFFYQKNQREPDSSILLEPDGKLWVNEDLTSLGVNHCTICATDRVRDYVPATVDKFVSLQS